MFLVYFVYVDMTGIVLEIALDILTVQIAASPVVESVLKGRGRKIQMAVRNIIHSGGKKILRKSMRVTRGIEKKTARK